MVWFRKKVTNDNIVNKKHKKVKIGLALGGGGARGFAHIGVLKAFEEAGIKFDFVAGTSVGSLVGALYSSGLNSDEIKKIALNLTEKDIKTSKIIFIPSKTNKLEGLVTDVLGEKNVEDLQIPFAGVVVDLKSTEEIAIRRGNLAKVVAGSCAVPGVFNPVEFEDKLLADGGLKNSIPADVPKLFGCDYVVAVDINSGRAYGTSSTKILDIMAASIRILMKSNAVKGYVYSEVMITPHLHQFKSTSLDGAEEMIKEGYRAAKLKIEEIKELFERKAVKRKLKLSTIFANENNKVIPNEFDDRLVQIKKEEAMLNQETEMEE